MQGLLGNGIVGEPNTEQQNQADDVGGVKAHERYMRREFGHLRPASQLTVFRM